MNMAFLTNGTSFYEIWIKLAMLKLVLVKINLFKIHLGIDPQMAKGNCHLRHSHDVFFFLFLFPFYGGPNLGKGREKLTHIYISLTLNYYVH